jgi:hypothetical protein
MRVAVAGSHSTGKSTLIAAFVAKRPQYVYEPEAYEALADDIALTVSEGPDVEGLGCLLEHTVSILRGHAPDESVIFERSPVDYLAYAAASRSIVSSERAEFMREYVPIVRESVRYLDLIVLLPVSTRGPVDSRPAEDERFRRRVDDKLRRALVDDDYDLFGSGDSPLVVPVSPFPDQQLAELMRRTACGVEA